jgi:uncharacterized membrane protein
MKAITRIRIILFALMVFGAFANFALNMWGDNLMVWCELLMALSFLIELIRIVYVRYKKGIKINMSKLLLGLAGLMVVSLLILVIIQFVTRKGQEIMPMIFIGSFLALGLTIIIEALYDFFKKNPNQYLYECYFLFCFFTGLVFRNAHLPGANILILFSILFLLPYFITTTIKFFKANYKHGKKLVVLLTVGCIATIFSGLRLQMKMMHWPWATALFYISSAAVALMILLALPWKFDFKNTKLNVLQGLKLLDTNIILIFFMLFITNNYRYLAGEKLVPSFYSDKYPKSVEALKWEGEAGALKADEIMEAYDNCMQKAEKNGFLK